MRAILASSAFLTSPADLTPTFLAQWAEQRQAAGKANNTIRGELTATRQFLMWCLESGHVARYNDRAYKRLVHSYPQTYGKVQGTKPANRMTSDRYQLLVVACQDGTLTGLRDELLVRLAVSCGMRSTEVRTLTLNTFRSLPRLHWIGKRNKPRSATVGAPLIAVLDRYLAAYQDATNRPLRDTDPLICCGSNDPRGGGGVRWGVPVTSRTPINNWLIKRAAIAGVGWVAPHDLKRTTATILHEATTPDGGHYFDLLDISNVLDHSNANVTKLCYIDPLMTSGKDRAAAFFD